MRAYVISTLLFLGIVLLAVLYLGQRWKWSFIFFQFVSIDFDNPILKFKVH